MKAIKILLLLTIIQITASANWSFNPVKGYQLVVEKRYNSTLTNSSFSNVKQASFTEYSAYIANKRIAMLEKKKVPSMREDIYKMEDLIKINIKKKQ